MCKKLIPYVIVINHVDTMAQRFPSKNNPSFKTSFFPKKMNGDSRITEPQMFAKKLIPGSNLPWYIGYQTHALKTCWNTLISMMVRITAFWVLVEAFLKRKNNITIKKIGTIIDRICPNEKYVNLKIGSFI